MTTVIAHFVFVDQTRKADITNYSIKGHHLIFSDLVFNKELGEALNTSVLLCVTLHPVYRHDIIAELRADEVRIVVNEPTTSNAGYFFLKFSVPVDKATSLIDVIYPR